jgi:hypothetical protein
MNENTHETTERAESPPPDCSVDVLIADLESRGLGWSLDNTGRLIEARVWDWPHVIGRYRPHKTEPLAHMIAKAMYQVEWAKYPVFGERRG